jgi:hypothetical protein
VRTSRNTRGSGRVWHTGSSHDKHRHAGHASVCGHSGRDAGAAPAIGGTVGQPGEPWNPTGCELSMRSPEVLLPTMIGRRGAQGGGGLKISSGRNRPFTGISV